MRFYQKKWLSFSNDFTRPQDGARQLQEASIFQSGTHSPQLSTRAHLSLSEPLPPDISSILSQIYTSIITNYIYVEGEYQRIDNNTFHPLLLEASAKLPYAQHIFPPLLPYITNKFVDLTFITNLMSIMILHYLLVMKIKKLYKTT